MPRTADLREQSRLYRQASRKEADPNLKVRLAGHALALAMLAEKIEREEAETINTKPPSAT